MRISWLYILLGFVQVSSIFGGNILVTHFPPMGSFRKLLDAILTKLAPHHTITMYSTSYTEFSHPNVSVVTVNIPPMKSYFSENLFETVCKSGPAYISVTTLTTTTEEYVDLIFNNENMTNLMASNEKYDLLITSASLSEYSLPFAHYFNVPLVQIAPTMPFPQGNDATGNSLFHTSTFSIMTNVPATHFLNRLRIYIDNMKLHLNYYWYYWDYMNQATAKYFPPGTPTVQQMNLNTSLVLTNINPALGYVQPQMPHMLEIGGIYCRPPKPLASNLEEFIQGAGEHGIIYVSFGMSMTSKMPESLKQMMVNTFAKLPQRILWKWNEDIDDLPPNVWASKWFSQQDVLGHNMTKLFVTQGGILSLQESVYHSVPVLVIPIAIDQPMNGFLMQQMGYGEYINFCHLTEELLYKNIQKIISEPKYTLKVNRVSELMKEELKNVDERLNNAVNYVIRHNGNPIIQQLPPRLTGLQAMDVDIIVFLVVTCQLACIFIVYLVFAIQKYIRSIQYSKLHSD